MNAITRTDALHLNFTNLAKLPEEVIVTRLNQLATLVKLNQCLLEREIYAELIPVLLLHGNPVSGYLKSAKTIMLFARQRLGGFKTPLKEKIQCFEDIKVSSGTASILVHTLLTEIPDHLLVKKQIALPAGFSAEVLNVYREYLYKGTVACDNLDLIKEALACSQVLPDPNFKSLCEDKFIELKDRHSITEEEVKLLKKEWAPKIFKEYFLSDKDGVPVFNDHFLPYLLTHSTPVTSWMRTIPFRIIDKSLATLFCHLCLSADLRLNNVVIDLSSASIETTKYFLTLCRPLFSTSAADHFFSLDCKIDESVDDSFILTSFARTDLLFKEGIQCLGLLKKAIAKEPESVFTLTTCAEYYIIKVKDFAKARPYAERAAMLDPNCKKAKAQLEQINRENPIEKKSGNFFTSLFNKNNFSDDNL